MKSQLLFLTLFLALSATFVQSTGFMDFYNSNHNFMQNKPVQSGTIDFARGFINAISVDPIFDSVKECIADEATVVNDLRRAFAEIRTLNPANVKAGIELLGKAADFLPTAMIACNAADADINKILVMVESFKNPDEFLYFVKKSIIINRVEVFSEIGHAMVANDEHNYYLVGYWVGKAMETVFLKQFDTIVVGTNQDVLDFAKGFLQGISSASAFDEIKACLTDAHTFGDDIYRGIKDLTTKDPVKVKEGIALLGEATQIIPAAAQKCKAAGVNVDTLYRFIKSFKSPESFLYYVGRSLLINRVEVLKEISSSITAYNNHDYVTLGYWIGKAMDTILLGQKSLADNYEINANLVNFAKGFFEGVGSASAFDQVRVCIADSGDFANDVSQAIKDLKTKNPSKVKEGIALLGKAAHALPNAVKDCQAAGVDLDNLLKMIKSFESPVAFLYYVGKSLLINRVEVMKEILHVIEAYDSGDFEQLGYWVGKAMDTIILGEHQTLSQDFVNHLNKVSGWKAAIPSKFEGMTYDQIKNQFLGAIPIDLAQVDNLTVFNYEGTKDDIPSYFNASEQWPGCIHPIRDQGHCGSCWAFAASEALSDRFCIASEGKINVVLSPQYLLACNVANYGCNGGVPLSSWWFITSEGLVSDECLPYASYNGSQPVKCKDFTKCVDGSPLKMYYGAKDSTVSLRNPASIQANLFQYGPVEAAFTVYQDFMYYKGGIYKHTSGSVLGGHAVKIIGWGEENGEKYWIIANSWGPNWGENGFFRIAFGQCGIDSAVVVAQADLKRAMETENVYEQFFYNRDVIHV